MILCTDEIYNTRLYQSAIGQNAFDGEIVERRNLLALGVVYFGFVGFGEIKSEVNVSKSLE